MWNPFKPKQHVPRDIPPNTEVAAELGFYLGDIMIVEGALEYYLTGARIAKEKGQFPNEVLKNAVEYRTEKTAELLARITPMIEHMKELNEKDGLPCPCPMCVVMNAMEKRDGKRPDPMEGVDINQKPPTVH